MNKVLRGVLSLSAACLALVLAVPSPTSASLMAISGFPAIVHTGQALSFSSDIASNTDHESMDIVFPAFDGIMTRSGTPTIPPTV